MEDEDYVKLSVNGRTIADQLYIKNNGETIRLSLRPAQNELCVEALNEGMVPPNTAALEISEVVEGQQMQSWDLTTGEVGRMTITAAPGRASRGGMPPAR